MYVMKDTIQNTYSNTGITDKDFENIQSNVALQRK